MTQTLQYRTAKVLDDAATLIETKGWCRGKHTGGAALHVAAMIAGIGPGDEAYIRAYEAVGAELRSADSHSYVSIPAWNDEQRDRRKVVRLLRRTARKVRRGQL